MNIFDILGLDGDPDDFFYWPDYVKHKNVGANPVKRSGEASSGSSTGSSCKLGENTCRDHFCKKNNYNISVCRDANNAVAAYKIYMVYAPYKKSEVEVQAEHDRITIGVGVKLGEASKTDKSDEIIFKGYECAPFEISIPFEAFLSGKNEEIDAEHISAKADDGLLEITVPILRKTMSRKVKLD